MEKTAMKTPIAVLALVLAACVSGAQSNRAVRPVRTEPAPAIYYVCDTRELVRLAGIVVGDTSRVGGRSFDCESTPLVCAAQIAAFDEQQRVDNLVRLADMVRVCRAAGY